MVYRSERSAVDSTIVDNQPSLPLSAVLREFFRRERGRGPLGVTSFELACLDFRLKLRINPIGFLAFQVVRRGPHGRPRRNGVM